MKEQGMLCTHSEGRGGLWDRAAKKRGGPGTGVTTGTCWTMPCTKYKGAASFSATLVPVSNASVGAAASSSWLFLPVKKLSVICPTHPAHFWCHTRAPFVRAKKKWIQLLITNVVPHLGNTKLLLLTDLAFIRCTIFPRAYCIWRNLPLKQVDL